MMKSYNKKGQLNFIFFALFPILCLYLIFRWWPILQAFIMSFSNAKLITRNAPLSFVGLKNYIDLLKDKNFITALKNTFIFAGLTSILSLSLAFFITLIMDRRRIKGVDFLQTLFFLPVVISVVPSAIIWKWMYDPQYGIFNYILSIFGLKSVGWLTDARTAMFSIIIFTTWKWLGYYMVIFWVGIKGIPKIYFEAAEIDGANEWNILRSIIIPLLKPISLFAIVFATVRGFTIFTEVYVMSIGSQGAPGNIVKVLTYDIYERAFVYYDLAQPNAEGVILFLLLLFFTIMQLQFMRKGELK